MMGRTNDTLVVRDFGELKQGIEWFMTMLMIGGLPSLDFRIDEFLSQDPHTIMLLTWFESAMAEIHPETAGWMDEWDAYNAETKVICGRLR